MSETIIESLQKQLITKQEYIDHLEEKTTLLQSRIDEVNTQRTQMYESLTKQLNVKQEYIDHLVDRNNKLQIEIEEKTKINEKLFTENESLKLLVGNIDTIKDMEQLITDVESLEREINNIKYDMTVLKNNY